MRKDLLIIALGLFLTVGAAVADVLAVPETDTTPALTLPAKGTSMADVEKRYGAPRVKQPTVGGDTPKQPPITRWDYDGFLLIFEHDKVVDAVIPGAPPKVYHKDELQPVATGEAPPPPPEMTAPMAEPAAPAPEAPAEPAMDESAPAAPPPDQPATETAPESPYPDRPTPAEAPPEETPSESPPTPR